MSALSSVGSPADADPRIARSRAKMLSSATELLIESGPRAVTADAVAEHSGVAKSTLYRHWPSINHLLIDVVRANVPSPAPVDVDGGFEPALRSWIDFVVETLTAPQWARILPALIELHRHSSELHDLLASDFDDKLSTVATILELGATEGRLPPDLDPRRVTLTLIGPLLFATLRGDADSVPDLSDYVLDRFLTSYRSSDTTP